jgi:hypothetical protein
MDWHDLLKASLGRPGMYVSRPYIDGLLTLWFGYGLGARDGNFERFCMWLQTERYPAPGGYKNPLTPPALIRHAVSAETSGPLTEEQDLQAVALLSELVDEFQRGIARS